jgi:hypothetical protein
LAKKNPVADLALKPPTGTSKRLPEASDELPEGAEKRELLIAALDCIVGQFIRWSEESPYGKSPSVSDLVRIVQLRKDLEPEELVKEIDVRWVDCCETDFSE